MKLLSAAPASTQHFLLIMDKPIIRVFPRRTNATPVDELVRVRKIPSLFEPEVAEIHISVTFTWDMKWAEWAATQWEQVAPVKIGGPACNEKSGDFVAGMYMKQGYTITSRGCPNNCWFCSVPKREGQLRELPIVDGWIIQDDNLLACSEKHINEVFTMLKRQPKRPQFTGGLEAKLLTQNMAFRLKELKPESLFFAYDTKSDYEPLVQAGAYLQNAGFSKTNHTLRCYVLCGYKGDTFDKAEKRMRDTWRAGFMPFSMLYKDDKGIVNAEWKKFNRGWANPFIVASKLTQ